MARLWKTHLHSRYIQQLLGHSKADTTALYAQVSITQLQAVHARCHPAEKRTGNHTGESLKK